MTLGTAASSSTTNPSGFPIFAGASVTNIAIPMLSGTPIAIANAEVTNVPTMYGRTPNDSRPSTGFQSGYKSKYFSRPHTRVKLPDWFRTIAQFWIDGKIRL